MNVGARVIRGTDWKYEDQDSGEGNLGTIVNLIGENVGRLTILWDNGTKADYRASYDSYFDIRLYDTATCGVIFSPVVCDGCKLQPITGLRWKCISCPDFDLCTNCYMSNEHMEHKFMRYLVPDSIGEQMPSRSGDRKIQLKGMLIGASVRKGRDWMWGDQDGNSVGTIIRIKDYNSPIETSMPRSFAQVHWSSGNKPNNYRIGFRGKVDLTCVEPTSGPTVYVNHLPDAGGAVYFSSWEYSFKEKASLNVDDIVTIPMKRIPKELSELIGRFFKIVTIEGENIVISHNGGNYKVNSNIIVKLDCYERGSCVDVISDVDLVKKLQEKHGGFGESHSKLLGKTVRIVCVDQDGDIWTEHSNGSCAWNRLCLRPSKGSGKLSQRSSSKKELQDVENLLKALLLVKLLQDDSN